MIRADRIMIWMMIILVVSSISYAIGVSPVRKVVDFEPNKEIDLGLKIRNEGNDIKAIISARGELAPYIGIVDSLVTITKDESEKIARYKLKLPASFEKPGIHKSELVVMEYPSSFGTGQDTVVSAIASVVSEIWVRVPFPGKYAEARLYIDSNNIGEDVQFAVAVMNFGKEDITKAKAKIRILGSTYEEIAVIETDETGIKAGGESKLTASWKADVYPGRYHVVVEIIYDGKMRTIEDNFDVGNLFIGIKRIDVKEFSLGDVAVFNILLESKWNEEINDVYGEMTILDGSNTELTTFKTASIDMPAMGQGMLKAYWDTAGMNVGKYNLRLLIHYAEKVTEKLIGAEVNIDSIRTELGPTAQVVAGKASPKDSLLTILVIVLIVVNVGWFVYFARRKKK